MQSSKPRIALFGMSIMGGGPSGEGIPVLADLFKRLSEHFTIVFYSFQPVNKSKVPSTITVKDTISWSIPGRIKYLLLLLRFAVEHLHNPYKLIFAVSIYPPGKAAVILGKIFRLPVVTQIIALEAVALPEIGYGNLTIPWLRKITKQVCEETDALVAVADYQKELALKSLPTTRKIQVLPLRIDYKKFAYKQRTITYPVQFIHIAYYSPIKDQDTMFAAFAKVVRVVDCNLTVVGDGYNIDKIRSMMHELNIADKVTFKGVIPQADIPSCFESAHILLHTARFETGCAVIQEAMASGVAVCGTNVGLLADIGDEYAIIVPPTNAAQLAEKILQLVNDPERYEEITRAAYQWISTYDAQWSAGHYRLFIEEMLEVN